MTRLDALLTAKHPLDKNSDTYLEGKDVIKVVHSLASGTELGLFVFDRSTLIVHTNDVIIKLSSLLNMSFVCHEPQVSFQSLVPFLAHHIAPQTVWLRLRASLTPLVRAVSMCSCCRCVWLRSWLSSACPNSVARFEGLSRITTPQHVSRVLKSVRPLRSRPRR